MKYLHTAVIRVYKIIRQTLIFRLLRCTEGGGLNFRLLPDKEVKYLI